MKHILPLSYPTITSYPGRANFYAIAEGRKELYPWLMERYIQTESYFNKETFSCDIDFFLTPQIRYSSNMALEAQNAFCQYIENFSLFTEIIGINRIIDFIKNQILEGYYIVIDINTGYIPAYKMDIPHMHNMMIYGFDDQLESFHIADFMKNGRYMFEICKYAELLNAIETFGDLDSIFYPSKKSKISLLKIKEKVQVEFHVHEFRKELGEYLVLTEKDRDLFLQTNWFNVCDNDYRSFGITHFDNLANYLWYCQDKEHIIENYRVFHVFYDHKKAMYQRIKYLNESVLDCECELKIYSNIVKEATEIRNSYLKSCVKKSIRDYGKIAEKIMMLKICEQDTLETLYEKLEIENR